LGQNLVAGELYFTLPVTRIGRSENALQWVSAYFVLVGQRLECYEKAEQFSNHSNQSVGCSCGFNLQGAAIVTIDQERGPHPRHTFQLICSGGPEHPVVTHFSAGNAQNIERWKQAINEHIRINSSSSVLAMPSGWQAGVGVATVLALSAAMLSQLSSDNQNSQLSYGWRVGIGSIAAGSATLVIAYVGLGSREDGGMPVRMLDCAAFEPLLLPVESTRYTSIANELVTPAVDAGLEDTMELARALYCPRVARVHCRRAFKRWTKVALAEEAGAQQAVQGAAGKGVGGEKREGEAGSDSESDVDELYEAGLSSTGKMNSRTLSFHLGARVEPANAESTTKMGIEGMSSADIEGMSSADIDARIEDIIAEVAKGADGHTSHGSLIFVELGMLLDARSKATETTNFYVYEAKVRYRLSTARSIRALKKNFEQLSTQRRGRKDARAVVTQLAHLTDVLRILSFKGMEFASEQSRRELFCDENQNVIIEGQFVRSITDLFFFELEHHNSEQLTQEEPSGKIIINLISTLRFLATDGPSRCVSGLPSRANIIACGVVKRMLLVCRPHAERLYKLFLAFYDKLLEMVLSLLLELTKESCGVAELLEYNAKDIFIQIHNTQCSAQASSSGSSNSSSSKNGSSNSLGETMPPNNLKGADSLLDSSSARGDVRGGGVGASSARGSMTGSMTRARSNSSMMRRLSFHLHAQSRVPQRAGCLLCTILDEEELNGLEGGILSEDTLGHMLVNLGKKVAHKFVSVHLVDILIMLRKMCNIDENKVRVGQVHIENLFTVLAEDRLSPEQVLGGEEAGMVLGAGTLQAKLAAVDVLLSVVYGMSINWYTANQDKFLAVLEQQSQRSNTRGEKHLSMNLGILLGLVSKHAAPAKDKPRQSGGNAPETEQACPTKIADTQRRRQSIVLHGASEPVNLANAVTFDAKLAGGGTESTNLHGPPEPMKFGRSVTVDGKSSGMLPCGGSGGYAGRGLSHSSSLEAGSASLFDMKPTLSPENRRRSQSVGMKQSLLQNLLPATNRVREIVDAKPRLMIS
jgi:hypothetical protein